MIHITPQGRHWLCETSRHSVTRIAADGDSITRTYPPKLLARAETPQAALAYAKIIAAGESIRACDEMEHEYFEAVIVALNAVEFVEGPDPRD